MLSAFSTVQSDLIKRKRFFIECYNRSGLKEYPSVSEARVQILIDWRLRLASKYKGDL